MDDQAPTFLIPRRKIVAVEHPMIVRNLDNGIKTFGTNLPFERIIDSEDPEDCVPLYLRYNDKMCVPILSRNTPTNNILLKITVPKRTGRKRKRGSQEPFSGVGLNATTPNLGNETPYLRSQGGLDAPIELQRKLIDNVGRYSIEVVGEIRQTHRYRCLTDFHFSVANTRFYSQFRDSALVGQVDKLRKFDFNYSKGVVPNEEIMPPPTMTSHPLQFNWQWHQNGNIFEEKIGDKNILVNRSKPRKTDVPYLAHDVPEVPSGPPFELQDDPGVEELVQELKVVLEERPVWTRRSLTNRLAQSRYLFLLRAAIQFVAYQFKGGPFRDSIIKYGIDPRKDKKYRKYQTFFFKLLDEEERGQGMGWHDPRIPYNQEAAVKEKVPSHIFDGQNLTMDGKVWQACDITDPMLKRIIENSPYREDFDIKEDGWFCNGAISKIKSIMKTKLEAIRMQKRLMDQDFTIALSVPDYIPGKLSREIRPALPDIRLSSDEINSQRMRGKLQVVTSTGVRRRDIMGRIKRTRGWGHQTMRSESSRSRAQQKENLLRQNSNPRGLISTRSNTLVDKSTPTRSRNDRNLAVANEATDITNTNLESITGENDSDGSVGSEDDLEIQDENGLEFIEADSSEHDDEFPDIPSDVEVDD
ncbi:BgTH12-02565 [Blumeria graminis f. sp. triticale]|uniref:Bgt-1701 n=3 Tax=Blumeria graminis TaxID=34373 RepID=A0A061HJK1_BLUGR|nr:subunit of the RNA polymerase III transcription initiation [Blumeria graminis f. sp. tritici 96224]CAD6502891.1 BgTH12-02565 [Blumeria graminis f. sp. triticale]VDB88685.1 Bgt-1701 [Blumeria graminis f. sp. tritici]